MIYLDAYCSLLHAVCFKYEGRERVILVINDHLIISAGADARHLHEGRVLADAAEGAEQREVSQGAHDPLRDAAQGDAYLRVCSYKCSWGWPSTS